MNTDPTLDEAAFDHMKAHLLEVKEKYGSDAAKFIIKTVGLVERMADIAPIHYDYVVAACKAKLNSPEEEVNPLDVVDPAPNAAAIEHLEQRCPLDTLESPAPAPLTDRGLQVAIEAIEAIPDEGRTTESALRAVWTAWFENGFFQP